MEEVGKKGEKGLKKAGKTVVDAGTKAADDAVDAGTKVADDGRRQKRWLTTRRRRR